MIDDVSTFLFVMIMVGCHYSVHDACSSIQSTDKVTAVTMDEVGLQAKPKLKNNGPSLCLSPIVCFAGLGSIHSS